METPELLINPVVRWATHPADQGRVLYIDGIAGPQTLPSEGEVITRPFLVDPVTRIPVPVRVTEIRKLWDEERPGHTMVVITTRDQ